MSSSSPISEPPLEVPSPPITLVLTIVLLTVFVLAFFSIYFCRCFIEALVGSANRGQNPNSIIGAPIDPLPSTTNSHRGLDSSIVSSFPTFTYSSVKDFRHDQRCDLECAICLCEFDDSDMLRLLTVCSHVFHQSCIDSWFGSHTSCPICRRNLDELDRKDSSERISNDENCDRNATLENDNVNISDGNVLNEGDVSIVIEDDVETHEKIGQEKGESSFNIETNEEEELNADCSKFSRSHSTGHFIDDDKYTLRLPEDVQETIRTRHMATVSCPTFDEYKSSAQKQQCRHPREISGCATC